MTFEPTTSIVVDAFFDGWTFHRGACEIVLDGPHISAVSTTQLKPEVAAPRCTAVPGLIDAHVHLCLDASRYPVEHFESSSEADLAQLAADQSWSAIQAGITTIRDCGSPLKMVNILRAASLTAPAEWPRLLLAGMPVTTVGGHCHFLSPSVPEDEEISLEALYQERVDLVKVMLTGGGLTPGSDPRRLQFDDQRLRRIVESAGERGLPVAAHAHTEESLVVAARSGVRSIEHGTGLRDTGVGVDPQVAAEVARAGTFVVPTLAGFIIACRRGVKGVQKTLDGIDQEQLIEKRMHAVGVMHSEGVRLVAGTDAGSRLLPFDTIGAEVRALHDAGLSVLEALAAATSAAADCLKLTDRGRLVAGALADISIVRGDSPMEILKTLEKPLRVFQGGVEVFSREGSNG